MKHEPRPAILLEKQLGWAHKLCGAETLWVSKAGQTVLARLKESQIWHQLAGSMVSGIEASALPNTRHFSLSLYTTGLLQATTPVLELRGSKSK